MDELLVKAEKTINAHGMVAPGELVLAAVSGGPDSMAMLYALEELRGRLDFELACAHMDHGLRPDSAEDAAFVAAACANIGIECVTGLAEPGRLKGRGINLQSAAREARYAFLEQTAHAMAAARIAVAHTIDDQAETYLMRELRGSGPRGLGSIPPVRGRVVRPLIAVPRSVVMGYLSRRGVGFRTDPTNLRTDYLRNRLRLELMPLLMEYNPNIVETFARSADVMRDEDALLDALAEEALGGLLAAREGGGAIDAEGLNSLHPALRRRVIRLAVARTKGDTLSLGQAHVEDALKLINDGGTGKGLDLPGGVRLELSYGRALFTKGHAGPPAFSVSLAVPGSADIPEIGVTIEAELVDAPSPPPGGHVTHEFFDAETLTGPLTVRNRRPGDYMYPRGMSGRKKLKEIFIDAKTPRRERDATPLVFCEGELAWAAGLRADRRFSPKKSAGRLVRLCLRKN